MSKYQCRDCGSDKTVASQETIERKREDGLIEQMLGEEVIHCKRCGSPNIIENAEPTPIIEGEPPPSRPVKDAAIRVSEDVEVLPESFAARHLDDDGDDGDIA